MELIGPTDRRRPVATAAVAAPREARSAPPDPELRKHLQPLAVVFDGSPEPVAVIDRAGRLRYANPPCVALFGAQAEELLGRPLADFGAH